MRQPEVSPGSIFNADDVKGKIISLGFNLFSRHLDVGKCDSRLASESSTSEFFNQTAPERESYCRVLVVSVF